MLYLILHVIGLYIIIPCRPYLISECFFGYWQKGAPLVPPVIIDLNEDSKEEDEAEQQQEEVIDAESDGFCILCGGEDERGRWQHENCMAPRPRAEARRSVGTGKWQCFFCKSL